MKKLISIITAIIIIGLIAWGVWFFIFAKNVNNNTLPNNSSGSLPNVPSLVSPAVQVQTQGGTSVSVAGISSPQNPVVAKDFLGEVQNANQIGLGGTVVTPSYALQIWGDTNQGGEALLEYSSSTGWSLVSLGGGEWNVLALVQVGVPVQIAQQLVAGLMNGTTPAPSEPQINIPTGNTIEIGTSKGTVTMNNFYESGGYVDQEQQAVIIEQSSTYSIVYNIPESSFTITILGAPSGTARKLAEATFLSSLGISQGDACELSVYESFPQNFSSTASADAEPQDLSFCTSNSAFQAP